MTEVQTFLDIALANASLGYPVFPAEADKTPKKGLGDWENRATTDEAQIRRWWSEKNYLPAIPPGRVGLAVIDVDRHVGKEDGFESLDKANVLLPDVFCGTSVSGNGIHYWFRHDVGSVNGIFPGVDRKARGGYVVAPYFLPSLDSHVASLPERLAGGVRSSNVTRNHMSSAQLNLWLSEVGDGEPSDEMWEIVEGFSPRGHQQMVIAVYRVVKLASERKSGASMALDRMLEKWTGAVHSSGDPEVDFHSSVRSAIEKYGEVKPDTTLEDKFSQLAATEKVQAFDKKSLLTAMILHWQRLVPDWPLYVESARQICYEREAVLELSGTSRPELVYWFKESLRQLGKLSGKDLTNVEPNW